MRFNGLPGPRRTGIALTCLGALGLIWYSRQGGPIHLASFASSRPLECGMRVDENSKVRQSEHQLNPRKLLFSDHVVLTVQSAYFGRTNASSARISYELVGLEKKLHVVTRETRMDELVLGREEIRKLLENGGRLEIKATVDDPGDWCARAFLVDIKYVK